MTTPRVPIGYYQTLLTHSQQGWAAPDLVAGASLVPLIWHIEGELDVDLLQQRYCEFMNRHPVVRSRFHRDGASCFQQPGALAVSPLDVEDVSSSPDAELAIWKQFEEAFRMQRPVEDARFRMKLYGLGPRRHILCGMVDHLIYDGESDSIFEAEVLGHAASTSSLAATHIGRPQKVYQDFVVWEQQRIPDSVVAFATADWIDRFEGLGFRPSARSSPEPHPRVQSLRFEIDEESCEKARLAARQHKMTMPMLVHTVLAAALARIRNESKMMLGVVWNGRPPGFQATVGCFSQMRPFLLSLDHNPDVATLLDRGRRAFFDATAIDHPIRAKAFDDYNVGQCRINYVRTAFASGSRSSDAVGTINYRHGRLNRRLRRHFLQDVHFGVSDAPTSIRGEVACNGGVHSREQLRDLVELVSRCLHAASCEPERRWSTV